MIFVVCLTNYFLIKIHIFNTFAVIFMYMGDRYPPQMIISHGLESDATTVKLFGQTIRLVKKNL